MYKTASIVLTLDFLIELIIRVIGCRDWPFDDVVIVFSVSRVTLFSLGPSALLGLDGRAKINTFIFGTSSTHVKCIGTKGGGGYRGAATVDAYSHTCPRCLCKDIQHIYIDVRKTKSTAQQRNDSSSPS